MVNSASYVCLSPRMSMTSQYSGDAPTIYIYIYICIYTYRGGHAIRDGIRTCKNQLATPCCKLVFACANAIAYRMPLVAR